MRGLHEEFRLTPLPAGGRTWPLDVSWRGNAQTGGAASAGGAALPEYGVNRGQAADAGLTMEGAFTVPAEAGADSALLLRLDSVGCFARLTLNGREAAAHTGSHTVWECPLDAGPGEDVKLALALKSGENVFSPYQTAGILRGLTLLEVPVSRLSALAVRADAEGNTGVLKLEYALTGTRPGDRLTAALFDADGGTVGAWDVDAGADSAELGGLAVRPWDAEHPVLYRLALTLSRGDTVLERVEKRVGFTGIRMEDPRILWNGKPLKLFGVNYREPLPKEGRDLRAELLRLRAAHVNFLRGMYYPYSEECLSLCDELGFYVEQCAPFQEVGQGIASTENTPVEAGGYKSQFAEMLRDSVSHPSVAIWSVGGDSTWGSNFRHLYRMAKRLDPKRPTNFYYAMTVPEEEPELDIWSVVFVDWRQPMDVRYDQMTIFHTHGAPNEIGYEVGSAPGSNKPVLHQMFAPPPVYNRGEAERDYGIHEFWGESVRRFRDKMWAAEGCLGGAVLAAADEDGAFSPLLKSFNWGVLDAKGGPKPEYHHLMMAYAPVFLECCERRGDGLELRVQNRFVHSDLSELTCRWRSGGKSGDFALAAAPGETASARIPAGGGEEVTLTFEAARFSHRHVIPAVAGGKAARGKPGADGGAYQITEDEDGLVVENSVYRFAFDKKRGLLAGAGANGVPLLAGGPCLQTTRLTLGEWKGRVQSASAHTSAKAARVVLLGAYGDVCRVRFTLDIASDGTLGARADILSLSKPMPHSVKAGVGIDPGGLNEWGIAWIAAPGSESLSWQRNAPLGWYPENHIGRAEGEAKRADRNDFTSMKHDVVTAALRYPRAGIMIPGDGCELSVRVEELEDSAFVLDDRDARIDYTGTWHEMDDYCGNYAGTESLSDEEGAAAALSFTGSGVRVYGPKDFLYGEGAAAIDGGESVPFCQYMDRVDLPGASRGYEKRYGQLLFEARDLPEGPHSLLITAKGKRVPGGQGAYVSLDRIVIESGAAKRPVKLILNRDYNYARLARGNYMRPRVAFAAGDSVGAAIRLYADEPTKNNLSSEERGMRQ